MANKTIMRLISTKWSRQRKCKMQATANNNYIKMLHNVNTKTLAMSETTRIFMLVR